MSSVELARTSLSQLLSLQKQVNSAIEMMVPSTLQAELIQRRANIRQFENNFIFPYQNQLMEDVMPGFLTNIANQLINPITKSIATETSILNQSSGSGAMSGRSRFSHPMGTLLNDIESFVTPSTGATSYSADDTIDVPAGETALGYYFTESTKFSNFPYTDLASMIADLDDVNGDLTSTIGFTIRTIGLSASQVQAAMVQIADAGQGNLPNNTTVFFTGLSQQGMNPSILDAIQFVAASSFQEAVIGAEAIGQQLITAAANTTALIQYLPYFAIAGAAIYIFVKAGGIEGLGKLIEGKA